MPMQGAGTVMVSLVIERVFIAVWGLGQIQHRTLRLRLSLPHTRQESPPGLAISR